MATTSSTTTSSPHIRSLIPARIDRLPWSKFHTRLVMALGVAWILDGLEITIASNVGPDLTLHEHAQHVRGRGQRHRLVVPDRRGHRRAVLRAAVRQARPEEPVHDHARRVPDRQRPHRGDAERRSLVHLPVRHPDHRGHGHRRRVRRDQLGDRRDDPGQVPRPRRPRGQRHLLGGRDHRHDRHAVGCSTTSRRPGAGGSPSWSARSSRCVIIYVRRNLPESPRWQIMHGRQEEAEASIREIEEHVAATTGALPPVDESKELEIRPTEQIGYLHLLRDALPALPEPRRCSSPR